MWLRCCWINTPRLPKDSMRQRESCALYPGGPSCGGGWGRRLPPTAGSLLWLVNGCQGLWGRSRERPFVSSPAACPGGPSGLPAQGNGQESGPPHPGVPIRGSLSCGAWGAWGPLWKGAILGGSPPPPSTEPQRDRQAPPLHLPEWGGKGRVGRGIQASDRSLLCKTHVPHDVPGTRARDSEAALSSDIGA